MLCFKGSNTKFKAWLLELAEWAGPDWTVQAELTFVADYYREGVL